MGTGLDFKPGHRGDVEIFLDEKMLLAPLRWKKPRMIFVCSMTDAFADFVKDEWLDLMFAVMAMTPQHTYQVLTKRAGRLRNYMMPYIEDRLDDICHTLPGSLDETYHYPAQWPLPNVWLGVSAEDQANADERIPDLLATLAAVRFVSLEPLLGPIDLRLIKVPGTEQADSCYRGSALHGRPRLDWVIVGGESGPHARPMSIQWVRELRDQCAAVNLPFFFKQFGEWAPAGAHREGDPGRFAFGDYVHDRKTMLQVDGYPRQFTKFGARSTMQRIGKKAAGRRLDGKEHNGMPT